MDAATEALDRAYSLPDHVWAQIEVYAEQVRQSERKKVVLGDLKRLRRPIEINWKSEDSYYIVALTPPPFQFWAWNYDILQKEDRWDNNVSTERNLSQLLRRVSNTHFNSLRIQCLEIMNDILRRHPEQRDLWSRLRAAYRRKQDLSWMALHDRFDQFLSVGATLNEQYFFVDAQQAGQWRKYDF